MSTCMLSKRDIADLATGAIEGGISYWCSELQYIQRDENGEWQPMTQAQLDQYTEPRYDDPEFWEGDKRGVMLTSMYDEDAGIMKRPLTASSLRGAFKYQPKHNKWQSDNWFPKLCKLLHKPGDYDAGDADTIVQIAVMGEVVYA